MKIERGYAQHLGSRQEQQDAGFVLGDEKRGEQLVLVADGMGGHAGGSLASAQVAETARRIWAEHVKAPIDSRRLLERIIREGHEAINRVGAEKGLAPRSTAAILHLRDGAAHWAHVGDTRIYRLRGGEVARLTRDHSVVQMLVDLGKVSEDEMGTHPDQNRLTQSLGGDAVPQPDFGSDTVAAHDAFLVCSDGLWEMIPPTEMAAALGAKTLGDDGARHLVERAFDRAKPKSDNITIALLRVGGPPVGATAAPLDEAPTTRIPAAPAPRTGGGAKWAFAAATIVALGAAAAVVYKPWEPQTKGLGNLPATGPGKAPDLGTAPPKPPDPPKQPDPPRQAEPPKPPEPPRQAAPPRQSDPPKEEPRRAEPGKPEGQPPAKPEGAAPPGTPPAEEGTRPGQRGPGDKAAPDNKVPPDPGKTEQGATPPPGGSDKPPTADPQPRPGADPQKDTQNKDGASGNPKADPGAKGPGQPDAPPKTE